MSNPKTIEEILQSSISKTLTMREISEGERMKVHPYWIYVNGRLFAFDFSFDQALADLSTIVRDARIDELKRFGDNYAPIDFPTYIGRRIIELKSLTKEGE